VRLFSFAGYVLSSPKELPANLPIHILRPDCPCGRLFPNQRASVDTIFRALIPHSRTLAATSAVLQSQRDFVIMRCQSPHEAALGERALPDRPAICYNSFREVSDSLQWTVHSQYRWCHLAGEPPWCCPKSFGISGHILS